MDGSDPSYDQTCCDDAAAVVVEASAVVRRPSLEREEAVEVTRVRSETLRMEAVVPAGTSNPAS